MRSALFVLVLAACSQGDPAASRAFDPCQPIELRVSGASAAQQASITDAFALWRARGIAPFAIGDAGELQIVFTTGNPAVYGYYDDGAAIVYVNADVADASQRTVTIAHELGHAIGLVHVPAGERASVMNPGNVTVDPTAADVDAVAARWGACAAR